VGERCGESGCPDAVVVLIRERWLCSKHFLNYSYQQLDKISSEMREPAFDESRAEATAQFLEACMRGAADIACRPVPLPNLEKARVIDVLLWASELHGRLRRSPRVLARIPVLLRSQTPDHPWEEKTETELLSRYGMHVCCRSEIRAGDALICVRLDNGRRVESRVAWTRRKATGEIEAGIEFPNEENFWGLVWTEPRFFSA
jgi:hypothetical protein